MPLIGTRGAASAQGFGEFAQQTAANYIEDVFSTYLYTGNGGNQTITNGIDVKTKGGLIWAKSRSGADDHRLWDTSKGGWLVSNTTGSSQAPSININNTNTYMYATTSGFAYGVDSGTGVGNDNGTTYVSWTFREQPKFFDVVTYTGTGSSLTVNHNLGSTPGCIIIKNYNPGNTDWTVYHRSLGTGTYLQLNNTSASAGSTAVSAVSSTTFTVAGGSANWNSSGQSYVAYLFAHDAGGFGTAGTDNVISCGSFTTDSTGLATVTLGYEPQWILYKKSATTSAWTILDTMRGMAITASNILAPNTSAAEVATVNLLTPTATGFVAPSAGFSSNTDYIYIAIRRGPMKTPTSGTSVYQAIYNTSSLGNKVNGTVGPIDLTIQGELTGSYPSYWMTAFDRLRGSVYLLTASTAVEASGSVFFDTNVGVRNGTWFTTGGIAYNFARAPGFFDVVVTPGINSSNHAIPHNLGVVPELIIAKDRNYSGTNWVAYSAATGQSQYLVLNLNNSAASNTNIWGSSAFTSSTFYVNDGLWCAVTGDSGVFYLFASCPGVSKVGSYTGTGATQTISCGFAARFVMIKRTDSTGDWWVWDTSRGMVAGTDPRLAFNNTAAQTNANWVYTNASGFQIVTTDASVNASGGTYIYLAIA